MKRAEKSAETLFWPQKIEKSSNMITENRVI